MPANRMNRDQFYAVMAPNDDARLRKILWTLYWRGNAQLRERIEDELRPPEQPKVKPKKELPDPDTVLDEVTTFVTLAKSGAYMAGDRRVHHTERSKWRLTFRRLAGDALAALQAGDPGPAQQAVAEMVDLACDMKSYDYFHSDDPVEAAKFVVSDAVAVLWESVLRHDGFAAFARRVPEQLIRWEADYGWTRQGYGQVPGKETALAVPLARLLTTPDMWRTFTEFYLDALDAAGRADPRRPRAVYGSFDETRYRRHERTKDLAAWHEMLLDRFAGTLEDELLDRLAASPGLAGPELTFLRARIAERRGDVTQAATLVTECLKELPGHQGYLDFAVEVGAELPPRARELLSERVRILGDAPNPAWRNPVTSGHILEEMKPARAASRRFLPTSPFGPPTAAPPAEQFAVRDQVTHDTYGLGQVIGVEVDTALVVSFGSYRVRIPTPCSKLTKL